ncbi:TPA: hypothetical protein HA241_04185 [Candidatus Woesearchaeota archaeon]|nr:hypothetical protein [Candidatus Woesearchaeota archaeon]
MADVTITYYCTAEDLNYVRPRVDFAVDHLRRMTDYLRAMQTIIASSLQREDESVVVESDVESRRLDSQWHFSLSPTERSKLEEEATRYHFNGSLIANVIPTDGNSSYQALVQGRLPDFFPSHEDVKGQVITLTVSSREDIPLIDHLLCGLLAPKTSQYQVRRLVPEEE